MYFLPKITTHKVVIYLFFLELMLYPIGALLEYGLGFNLKATFFLRFSYIGLFFIALFYHFLNGKKIVINKTSIAFIFLLFYGSLLGVINNNLNYYYFSHILYVVMPIIMMSYGSFFFKNIGSSKNNQKAFKLTIYWSFWLGAIIVLMFVFFKYKGYATYPSIDIYNLFYSAPYFLAMNQGGYFYLGVFLVLLAGKRSMIVVFIVFILMKYLFFKKKITTSMLFIQFSIFAAAALSVALGFDIFQPFSSSIDRLVNSGLNGFSSGRLSESSLVIDMLISRLDYIFFGAGFGVNYEVEENFFRHYAHISYFSYSLIGGFIFSTYVYYRLFNLVIGMIKATKLSNTPINFYLLYLLVGVILMSIFGGSLMNNPWLWLVIGGCHGAVRQQLSCK
jgi:hypothetical protein